MKTQTVTVTFEMPIGHLDADSILEKMQDTVEDIYVIYGETHVPHRKIADLLNVVSVSITGPSVAWNDANPVPTSSVD